VTTEFARHTGLGLFVPIEMTELYDLASGRIEAKARYSNFRRFEVTTEETVAPEGSKAPATDDPGEAPPPAPPP
jgi:hypothetical protein